ncbi:MAG: rRNA maturation RNase YbeY [Patescibacteria group bacterium]
MTIETVSYVRTGGISRALVTRVVGAAARALRVPENRTIAVVLAGDERMKTLHAKYSGEATVTDVLSFPAHESHGAKWPRRGEDEVALGELVLCVPQIVRQARTHKVTIREEATRMLVHGLLHLLGHDHGKKSQADKMYALQEKIVYTISKS